MNVTTPFENVASWLDFFPANSRNKDKTEKTIQLIKEAR